MKKLVINGVFIITFLSLSKNTFLLGLLYQNEITVYNEI